MKKHYEIIWIILLIQLMVITISLRTAKVDDMTLAKGQVQSFDEGWVLVREDGETTSIQKLPYNTTSRASETVTIENIIPEEYKGKTLSVLSADKMLRITVDGEEMAAKDGDESYIMAHHQAVMEEYESLLDKLKAILMQKRR